MINVYRKGPYTWEWRGWTITFHRYIAVYLSGMPKLYKIKMNYRGLRAYEITWWPK